MRALALALATVVFLAALAAGTGAQPLGTDVFGAGRLGDLLRFTPGGAVTTVGRFGDRLDMVTMDADNRSVIAIENVLVYPRRVMRIDPNQGTRRIVWKDEPFLGGMTWVDVDQDGDYLVSEFTSRYEEGSLYKIARDGKRISTVFTEPWPGRQTHSCFVVDKGTGDYLLGEWYGSAVVRVDRDTRTITTIVPLGTGFLSGMAQDPCTSMVYVTGDNRTAMVVGYDPVTNAVSRIAAPGSSTPTCITVDRSPGTNGAMIYVGVSTSVHRFDRNGNNLGILGDAGPSNYLSGITFDRSRNLASILVTAPNDRIINVDFPGDSGRSYVVAFSLSGYTSGIGLPDGRTIPLNPDGLTVLTANLAVPPFISGNIGVLDRLGQATVRLTLNGASVGGLRLWAAAVTIDPNGPMGIGQISAPLLFVL